MLQLSLLNVNDYRIHFLYMSKDESINLLRNADLNKRRCNIKGYKFSKGITYKRRVKK